MLDNESIYQTRLNKIDEILGIKYFPNAPKDKLTQLEENFKKEWELLDKLEKRVIELEKARQIQIQLNSENKRKLEELVLELKKFLVPKETLKESKKSFWNDIKSKIKPL